VRTAAVWEARPPDLRGRWSVAFTLSEVEEHVLRFDARAGGLGTFLLLDPVSSLVGPASPGRARWSARGRDQVTFSGEVEFPIGNVGRDPGTLVFRGALDRAGAISGRVAFYGPGQDIDDPATAPSRAGDFTARRERPPSPGGGSPYCR
jgi:hypothetical protein